MSDHDPIEARSDNGERVWITVEVEPDGQHVRLVRRDDNGVFEAERRLTRAELKVELSRMRLVRQTLDERDSPQHRN